MDLAGREFWDGFWARQDSRLFSGLSHFHNRMSALLLRYAPPGSAACEIGCGASTWLPVLAARGVRVSGIDYSERGLALSRANLARKGVRAELIHGDVRDPKALPSAQYDLIFSLGFIEHFDDAPIVMGHIAGALRPGGVIVTVVPNFTGIWGRIQRQIDPELYAVHTIYTGPSLDTMHREAGLTALEPATPFGGFGPLVVNYTRPLGRIPAPLRATFIAPMWALQQSVAWGLATVGARDRATYSSHIAGVYRAS